MTRSISAASNIAVAALALCVLAGNASAAPLCARPQDMTALQAAALRQELMVAALSCRAADDFNLFVTTYRDELLVSDRALKAFFLRQGASKGEAAYDAYKTRLANEASQRSLHDPRFCRNAKMVFDVALKRSGALAALKSQPPRLIATGYTVCSPGKEKTLLAANVAPSPPPRRLASLEKVPSVPVPKAAPRLFRVSPPQRVAMVTTNAPPIPAPTQRVVSESLPPVSVAVTAAPRGRALAQAAPPRDFSEFGAGDLQADAQLADNGERDDFGNDAADAYDDADDDAGDYAPRTPVRYADAAPARVYGRGDGSGDYRSNDASYGDVPEAYRPGAYWSVTTNRPRARALLAAATAIGI